MNTRPDLARHLCHILLVSGLCLPFATALAQPTSPVPFDLASSIAQVNKPRLDRIRRHPKLVDAESVLTEFRRGDLVTRVIITLKPSAEADDLATQSQRTTDIPEEFQHQGAPVFYDLANQVIRTQLRERVRERVAQVIDHTDIPGVEVTQRFSYQFGYAALVTDEGLEQLLADPDVIRVERDWVLEAHTEQGIPLMNAATPSSSYDGRGLSIAICDTGIDTSHPRLGGGGFPNSKVIGGYDTGDNDSDPRPSSNGNAHGTACAGIAAGDLGSVGDYVGGVAPGARLYSIKISYGTGGSAYTSDMIEGWEWAIQYQNDDPINPIQIISTSFGGGRYYNQGTCDSATPAMTTAAANAVAAGITIFASSGNNGYCSSMGWPACISYVNSVGAVYDASLGTLGWCVSYDSACTTRATANTGCSTGYAAFDSSVADKVTAYSNSASFLSLFAPSNNAYTTDIVGSGGYSTGDYTTGFGGTSAACPYAAGAAAVLQHAAKAKTGTFLTPAQVREHLTTHGDPITDGKISTVTKPRINLAGAVDALPSTGQTPSLSIDDISLNEGNSGTTSFIFTVTLSAASSSPVTVNFATAAGSAAAPSDFTSTSGTLTFDSGQTSQTLTASITGDTVSEPNEIFYVNLSSPTYATLADSQGVGTIVNDDVSPALSITDVSLTEGNSGTKIFAFTVTLTPSSTGTVTVRYATANGTATTSNRDYSSTSGTLTFSPGDTSNTVSVSVRGDTRRENNETFYLNLSSASGASLADRQGLGTILNDD